MRASARAEMNSAPGSAPIESGRIRLPYIDNLRWTMIVLVISMHAADTYSPLGNWYFVDRRPLSVPVLLTFAAWQMYLQCFFMGLLFFIAGFFVPSSFDRKGSLRFLRDRAFRLGLPTLLYMFCIGPVTEYYLAKSWTSTMPTSFVNEWIKHILNGQFLQENGPLWFCVALLIFSAGYTILRTWRARRLLAEQNGQAPGTGKLIAFMVVMAASTFLIRVGRPSPFLNIQLGDVPQYVLLFGAGIVAARHHWLPKLRLETGLRWMAAALTAGVAGWLSLLVFGGALHGRAAEYSGGWHWQNAALSLWEGFTCIALCFGLVTIFREKLNSQGRVAKFLSENAFSVYVFHPPIVVIGARLLARAPWLPLIKFAALTGVSAVASFALSAMVFRRIPVLRRIT